MFTIDELAIPSTLEAGAGDDFARAIEVGNRVEEIAYGTPDLAYEPAEELPYYSNPFEPKRLLVARVEGEIVGRATYETLAGEDIDSGWLALGVLPEFEGRGIGRALADAAEDLVAADGKPKAIAYCAVPELAGPRLPSPTGFGSVPADARAVRFLLARGYTLEQVERVSRLPLPVADLRGRFAAARAASGPDYALHYWVGRTPEHWQEDVATLGTRMSTDAPTAGLEEPEDVWTVERVIASDDRSVASPRDRVVAAVEHVPTGRLAGFTILSVPQQSERAPAQYATLVLREHRGNRLGMLLKVANLVHLEEVAPGHPSIITFNAEENRHMLSVNEHVGFVPIGYEGAWRKNL
jgi:GNAT superfamily N-acetyltransferase